MRRDAACLALALLMIASVVTASGAQEEADYDSGIEGIYDMPEEREAVPYQQTVMPSPPQPQLQQQQAGKKPGLFGRMFTGLVGSQKFSKPINQFPKVPKDPKRDPVALSNPMLRLPQPIEYEGHAANPGIYLLGFQPGSGQAPSLIQLIEKGKTIFSVPARSAQAPPTKPATASSVKPEDKKDATPLPATASVEFLPDGRFVTLVYQDGTNRYVSDPIAIGAF